MATFRELLHTGTVSRSRGCVVSRLGSRKYAAGHRVVLTLAAALTFAASGDSAASQGLRKDDVQKMSRLSGLPGPSVVSTRQGLAVAIRSRGVKGPGGIVEGVELHGEVLDPGAVPDMGFASMRSRVDVDCANRRDRVVSMEVFASAGLEGEPERRTVPGGWVQPSPQAYLADVMRAVCGLRRSPDVQVASLAQDSDLPIATAVPKRPALRPAIGMTPAPTETAAPPAPKPATPKPPQKAAEARAKAPARTGSVSAQVAALGSRAAAEQTLNKVARLAPAGISTRVEPATVDGRDFYRALVQGFDTRAEASRFCRAVVAGGGDCFVR
jgi:hypothetical protein